MASDDQLKGFKISDQVRTRVDRPAAAERKGPGRPAEEPSVGFPRIEALVGSENPDLSGLSERMAKLQELAATGSMKEKAGARKAAVAYERATDLLEHLLATKASLQGQDGGAGGAKG